MPQINAESDRRQRIADEMLANIKPDDADHTKKPRGPEQWVDEVRQAFRAGADREKCLADLMEIRQNCGDKITEKGSLSISYLGAPCARNRLSTVSFCGQGR
jgi:hypothetical protein